MIIRRETPADIAAITDVTVAAFRNHPFSHQTEQFIVNALRAASALAVSLVAEMGGQVVGHIAFSPVTVSDGTSGWYGLGPVSVLPQHQRRGIGKALIQDGLSLLRALGASGCALVGDPGYYARFGFRNSPSLTYEGVPHEFFLVLPFGGEIPRGVVVFHGAFLATG
jgi:putative acetyltransferase